MPRDYPENLQELERLFPDEASCRNYLLRLRWPAGFVCPECGEKAAWKTNRDLQTCKACGFQASLTAGTIFHGTRKPLALWFRAMWHITNQKYGANAIGLQRVLGLGSYHTAWEWLHKLRRAMVRPDRDRLKCYVEVDETFLGAKHRGGKRGRGAPGKIMVAVAVEIEIVDNKPKMGRIRLQRIKDASSQQLLAFVQANVEEGSTIRTDGWEGYNVVASHGFTHDVSRASANVGDDLLPRCHLVVSLLKRWFNGTYQGAVMPGHVDYYLDEFTFRFNRRKSKSRGLLFYRLVQQALIAGPVYGKEIEGGIYSPSRKKATSKRMTIVRELASETTTKTIFSQEV